MLVNSRNGDVIAKVLQLRPGVLVILERPRAKSGHRYMRHCLVDAPMHLVLDAVYDDLWKKGVEPEKIPLRLQERLAI